MQVKRITLLKPIFKGDNLSDIEVTAELMDGKTATYKASAFLDWMEAIGLPIAYKSLLNKVNERLAKASQ